MDHATNATATAGILQYGLSLPAEFNPWLQTVFFIVSILWVATQIYFKWFRNK